MILSHHGARKAPAIAREETPKIATNKYQKKSTDPS
jgi:hypothetical protein